MAGQIPYGIWLAMPQDFGILDWPEVVLFVEVSIYQTVDKKNEPTECKLHNPVGSQIVLAGFFVASFA